MNFLDTLCKDIARMQRESIEKSKKRHMEIIESFGDDFADEIEWQPLLRYGYFGNRKVIECTTPNKEIMTIKNDSVRTYVKLFMQKTKYFLISTVIIYIYFKVFSQSTDIAQIMPNLRKDLHTNPSVYYILIGIIALIPISMAYHLYILVKRKLTEVCKVIVNKDFQTIKLETLLDGEEEIYLGNIHAIQVIKKSIRSKKRYHIFYEANLVLADTTRRNIINNSSRDDVLRQAEELGTYVNKPIWNAIKI